MAAASRYRADPGETRRSARGRRSPPSAPPRFAFDKDYYDRFYRNPKTRVASQQDMRRLVGFVAAYLAHIDQPVHSVLDVGCGLGQWRAPLHRHCPAAKYTGVEISDYLCREFGWHHGSIVDFPATQSYDLVICHGVLQYLSARDARRATANLARLSHGAVFLEALTAEDWERNCDRSVTDGDVFLREAAWYRREIARHFTNCGGGLLLSPRSPAVVYELEKLE